MKALSIKQPYLDQIIQGIKRFEYRNWKTNYRGLVLLCSSKKSEKGYENLICGKALVIVELIDIIKNTFELNGFKYAWKLKVVNEIKKPFDVTGRLGLFDITLKIN